MPLPLLDEKFGRSFTCGMAGGKPGPVVGNTFLSAIHPGWQEPRRRRGPAADRFFLPLRLDRRHLVAGVTLINVDERSQSDPGQFSDPDRANSANFTARRQSGFWMRYGHLNYH
jgi:hypothetical protein